MSVGELQKTVYSALAADAELANLLGSPAIYDDMPTERHLPCIVLGEFVSDDWSSDDGTGDAITFTLRCWSNASGRREVHAIAERARMVLLSPISLAPDSGFRMVLLHPVSARYERDVGQAVMRATLRFRALVEPSN